MAEYCKHWHDESTTLFTIYKCDISGEFEDVPDGFADWVCYNENYACAECPRVKKYGWFITSKTFEILDKEDSPVKEKLFLWKEAILENDEKYKPFLELYSSIGPVIAEKMDEDPIKEEVAQKVYLDLLSVVDSIDKEDFDSAYRKYVVIMLNLVSAYLLHDLYRQIKNHNPKEDKRYILGKN